MSASTPGQYRATDGDGIAWSHDLEPILERRRRAHAQPAVGAVARWVHAINPGRRCGWSSDQRDRRPAFPDRAQGRRSARPCRAAARPVLPLRRSGPARRPRSGLDPAHADSVAPSRASGPSRSAARWPARLEIEERLDKKKALAIFSSDAISSSAYATEEILRVLVLGGAAAMLLSIEVSIAIAILLAVVSLSYRQVCRAYPNGGGAYVVARTNLAPIFGLVAAASLLIDYVMTVAVSTAAAIAQIQSVIPAAYDYRILIAFVSIGLITVANLRGLRESGNIFAVPTYLFLGLALSVVAIGVYQIAHRARCSPVPVPQTRCPSGPRRSASCCCSRPSPAARSP